MFCEGGLQSFVNTREALNFLSSGAELATVEQADDRFGRGADERRYPTRLASHQASDEELFDLGIVECPLPGLRLPGVEGRMSTRVPFAVVPKILFS